jgi:Helix-turn-helix of insertion element transposase
MSLTQEQISNTFNQMQERSEAPKLTPEQLNAIDLLIFGKTDKEVAETVGVGRNTISKWYKNAFFTAELNAKREELWKDSKNRLKALVHEAVNVLSNGLQSSDEKVAVASAVHILKTVGLYGEVKDDFGPTTPEKAVWDQRAKEELEIYMALRPDSFCEWSVRNHMEELAQEEAQKYMGYWYERAADEQKKELREYKKKAKTEAQPQPLQIEPVPLTIEDIKEDLSQGQAKNHSLEPINV